MHVFMYFLNQNVANGYLRGMARNNFVELPLKKSMLADGPVHDRSLPWLHLSDNIPRTFNSGFSNLAGNRFLESHRDP